MGNDIELNKTLFIDRLDSLRTSLIEFEDTQSSFKEYNLEQTNLDPFLNCVKSMNQLQVCISEYLSLVSQDLNNLKSVYEKFTNTDLEIANKIIGSSGQTAVEGYVEKGR